jgi:D-2-hydroxyacid dehydrogenase (NADP+)
MRFADLLVRGLGGHMRLDKFVIGAPIPERFINQLEEDFPGTRFVVATDESFRDELSDADATVSWRLLPEEVEAAPQLKWLQTVGAGVDDIISPAIVERGLIVTNNSGVHASNIAEHVLSMMLAFARRLPFQIRGQINHEWRDETGREGVFELGGQTLLLVGVGNIGSAIGARAKCFGMTVIGVRRRPDREPIPSIDEQYGVDQMKEQLLRADHVVIAMPLTSRSRRLFDGATIAAMKRGAYLYNIGRGPIIDTDALIDRLQSGHLAGAGLDVTDPEPLPPDSPLWDLENVIITSHTSGGTPKYWDRAFGILHENIRRYIADEPLQNSVDVTEGY